MENNNNKKLEVLILLMLVIIIILIILMFLIINYFGKINNKPIPTGNVDIFEIIFESNKPNDNSSQNDGNLLVYDNEQKYSQTTQLEIFKHASYHIVDGLIAPGAQNSYQFVMKNDNNFDINYQLDFTAINNHNINMKYRLKRNGKSVLNNNNEYVSLEQLNQYRAKLDRNSYDVYTLDWKWFESQNDTYIGTQIQSNYKMSLRILVEM